jgi:hypothetical protein
MLIRFTAALLLSSALLPQMAFAQDTLENVQVLDNRFGPQVQEYMVSYSVDEAEAECRLAIMKNKNGVKDTIEDLVGDDVSGVWLEHSPAFKLTSGWRERT